MLVLPNTQAILLLTAHFSSAKGGVAKPLTPKEWGRFAVRLKEKELTPENLMTGRPDDLLQVWSDKRVTIQRIEALMDRGSARCARNDGVDLLCLPWIPVVTHIRIYIPAQECGSAETLLSDVGKIFMGNSLTHTEPNRKS